MLLGKRKNIFLWWYSFYFSSIFFSNNSCFHEEFYWIQNICIAFWQIYHFYIYFFYIKCRLLVVLWLSILLFFCLIICWLLRSYGQFLLVFQTVGPGNWIQPVTIHEGLCTDFVLRSIWISILLMKKHLMIKQGLVN